MRENGEDQSKELMGRREFVKFFAGASLAAKEVYAGKPKDEEFKVMPPKEAVDYLNNEVTKRINNAVQNPEEPETLKTHVQRLFANIAKGVIAPKFTNEYYTSFGAKKPDKKVVLVMGYEKDPKDREKITQALTVSVPGIRDYINGLSTEKDLRDEDIDFAVAANYAYYDIYNEVSNKYSLEQKTSLGFEQKAELEAISWGRFIKEIIRPRVHLRPNHKLPETFFQASADLRDAKDDYTSKEWLQKFIKKEKGKK